MTNFDYLKSEKEFESFVNIAITAEKVLSSWHRSGLCLSVRS